jgi:hypothetical protein
VTSSLLQPSFSELGTPLSQVTFCVVDLETTGSGGDDTITEIGAVKVSGGQVLGEFQTLVNPNTHIPALIAILTGITDQLVAEGLVDRLTVAGDRRACRVRLTPKGRRLFREMAHTHEAWIVDAFAALSEKELATFYRLLGKVKDHARSHQAAA